MRAPSALVALCLLLGVAAVGCDTRSDAASSDRMSTSQIDASIEHLIELGTPLDPTLTSDYHDRHHQARVAYLAEMKNGGRALGQQALARFREVEEQAELAPILVRLDLLTVAAHCATEDTQPLLESLLLEYGHRIEMRAEAALIMGEVSPKRAEEIIRPFLERTKNTSTMPDDEFLLQGYIIACKGSGVDPVPILANVATNIYKQDAARHRAVQELGLHKTRYAQQALRSILVESTGNAYLRRKAAQAIRDSFPREEACAIFEAIAKLEADNNFLAFIGDMIAENCE